MEQSYMHKLRISFSAEVEREAVEATSAVSCAALALEYAPSLQNVRNLEIRTLGYVLAVKPFQPEPEQNDAVAKVSTEAASRDTGLEPIQALRGLVNFNDTQGNCCFCDQYKDPVGLQHSGACLAAQEVLRRADSR